jgi:PAS domain S-box-containing protein
MEDVTTDPAFVRKEAAAQVGLKSAVGISVQAGEEVVAVLTFFSRALRPRDQRMIAMISAIALQLSVAFQHKRAADTVRRQRDELTARARIIGAILRTRDLDERLQIILQEAIAFLQVEMGCVYLAQGSEVVLRCWGNAPDRLRAHLLSFPADNLPTWMQEPTVLHENFSEAGGIPDFFKQEGIQAFACIPLALTPSPSKITIPPPPTPPARGGESATVAPLPLREGLGEGDFHASWRANGAWLGAVTFCSRRLDALNDADVRALQAMAEQLALAIDHARRYRESEQRLLRLSALREIDRAIISYQSVQDILRVVLSNIPQELGADAVAVSLLDEEQLRTRVFVMRLPNGTVVEEEAFSLADSLIHYFIERKEPVIICDLLSDPRAQMHRERIRHHQLTSYLGMPLVAVGRTIGILHLLTTEPKVFADEDVDFFRTLAGQAAIGIENSRMMTEMTERAQALEKMVASMVTLAGVAPPEQPSNLVNAFREVTRAKHVGYYRLDESEQTLTLVASVGCSCSPEIRECLCARPVFRLEDKQSLVSQAALMSQPFYVPDCHAAAGWTHSPVVRSAHFIPLSFGARMFGVVVLLAGAPHAFTSHQRSLADLFATYAAAAMEAGRHLQQAHASEERYRRLAENAPDIIYRYRFAPTRGFDYINPAATAMTGYTPEEHYADPDLGLKLAHPDDRVLIEAMMRQGITPNVPLIVRWFHKNGMMIWTEQRNVPIRDEAGNLVAIEGIARDVTERYQAEQALIAYARQQAAVAQLGQRALTDTDLFNLMDEAVILVAETLNVELSKVLELLPSGDALLLRAGVGWKEGLVGHVTVGAGTDSQAGYTLLSSEPVVVEDLRTEARFNGPPLLHEHGVVSGISVIIGSKERPYGVLGAHTSQRRTFIASEVDFLQAVANVLAEAIERKRAEESLQQQFTRLSLLHQITRAIAERHDLHSIFQSTLQRLEDYLPIDYGGMWLYNAHAGTLTVAARGPKSQPLAAAVGAPGGTTISVAQTTLQRCLRGETVYVPDLARVETPPAWRMARVGMRSAVAVPLNVEEKVLGLLTVGRRAVDGFSSAECEFLRVLSEHVALAAHQAQLRDDLQRAYDDLRQTQQAVMQQERLRALGQMTSGIVHDINNAISPVVGYAELLLMQQDEPLSDRARGYVENIRAAGADIAHIVARMREFYRQRTAQEELFPFDLNHLVRQVIDLTRPRWKDIPQQRGVVIDVVSDLCDDLPEVLGLESEVREALTNLIFNAVDAMPDGGTVTVRTSVECRVSSVGETTGEPSPVPRPPSLILLSVSDTGVGMTEETRQRCLEPFFSTKGERGTGLGLAMVYGTMQRHDGDIQIESALGKGTTVRLIFPAREFADTSVPDVVATSVVPPLRILFIDDEPLLRQLMKELLEADGHTVEVADGGQAGLDAFRSARERGEAFDVVITDLGMPYVSGREVARTVKRESPNTSVILQTGWGTRLGTEGDIPAEVDAVLSKPPRVAQLRDALRRVAMRP